MKSIKYLAALALGFATLTPCVRAADDETMKPDETMSKTDAPRRGAASRATSRPVNGPNGQFIQRIIDNGDKLDLTDEQKTKLQKIADDAKSKLQKVMEDADGDRDKARQQATQVIRGAFEDVRAVLKPEQQRKLRDIMQENGGAFRRNEGRGQNQAFLKEKPVSEVAKPRVASTQPVDATKIKLTKLDGQPFYLSSLTGKPAVLIFGSYSCPNFRDHAKVLDQLAVRYGTKASVIMVYTKEAYPAGGWEVQRNKDAEIEVKPAADIDARIAAAKQLRAKLGLTAQMVVDPMDDTGINAFDTFPNGVVILDRSGHSVAIQKWAEPEGIRTKLDEILQKTSTLSASAAERE
jgi:Spy/CpxP family protein refolding chaperone